MKPVPEKYTFLPEPTYVQSRGNYGIKSTYMDKTTESGKRKRSGKFTVQFQQLDLRRHTVFI